MEQMSKSYNHGGKTLIVDEVVQLANDSGSGDFASTLEGLNQKMTQAQVDFYNTYSIAVSGAFVATKNKSAEITLNIYRNDTKLIPSDSVVFGSTISYVSENGTYAEYGEYASHYKRTIPISKLKNQTESIRVVWKGNDANAVPLSTTFKIDVGEVVQYAFSKYTDEDKVKTQELVWWDTVEDAKSVTSDDLRYLWQRRTSTYDFTNQTYIDWKYYKTDIDYPARSTEDTAKDTIEIITPAKYVNFLSSKNTFTVNRRAKDAEADIITFSYACSGYKAHEIDTANPWTATAYKSNGEVSQLATGTATTFTITVPHNEGYSSIVVTATVLTNKGTGLEESHAYTLTLTPIDVTLPEKYLGVLTTLPTGGVLPDGSRAENGDWFVYKDTNVMYVYDSATLTWTAYDSSDSLDTIPLEKVSVALGDMINLGTNDHTTATLIGVFKALCADRGFIKFLQTYSLLVSKNNFKVEISATDPTTGEDLANPLFRVQWNNSTVYQIDPSTGNVFMGRPNSALTAPETGFMYDASAGCIKSPNEKVYISPDSVKLSNILITGDSQFNGSFDCDVIKTEVVAPTQYTFSHSSSEGNLMAENIYKKLINYGLTNGKRYNCSVSGYSSIKYVTVNMENPTTYWNYVTNQHKDHKSYVYVIFFDIDGNIVTPSVSNPNQAYYQIGKKLTTCSYRGATNYMNYATNGISFSILIGGNRLVVDIPNSSDNLPSGAIYHDSYTLKIKP